MVRRLAVEPPNGYESMKMNTSRTPLVAAVALLVSGLHGPAPTTSGRPCPVPATYQEAPPRDGARPTRPPPRGPKGDWWSAFDDPLLDQLEPLVSVSNQTVRQDYANYQEALAEVRVARSALFPTIGVTGSVTRQRTSAGSFGGGGAGAGAGLGNFPSVNNSGSLEGNVSWDLDLWGAGPPYHRRELGERAGERGRRWRTPRCPSRSRLRAR